MLCCLPLTQCPVVEMTPAGSCLRRRIDGLQVLAAAILQLDGFVCRTAVASPRRGKHGQTPLACAFVPLYSVLCRRGILDLTSEGLAMCHAAARSRVTVTRHRPAPSCCPLLRYYPASAGILGDDDRTDWAVPAGSSRFQRRFPLRHGPPRHARPGVLLRPSTAAPMRVRSSLFPSLGLLKRGARARTRRL